MLRILASGQKTFAGEITFSPIPWYFILLVYIYFYCYKKGNVGAKLSKVLQFGPEADFFRDHRRTFLPQQFHQLWTIFYFQFSSPDFKFNLS